MTSTEFTEAIAPKVTGTLNLHTASQHLNLDFFTLLSSICGLAGQKGQANYSAANVFLDSFAAYRHSLGLPCCSVDLGVIDDVGYVNARDSLARRLAAQGWVPIREGLLHKICCFSIMQQRKTPVNPSSAMQLITGIPVPLPEQSPAQRDVRFSLLRHSGGHGGSDTSTDDPDNSPVMKVRAAWKTGARPNDQILNLVTGLYSRKLQQSLGLDEALAAARPLSSYGIDSLVAVEFRNWAREELDVEMTTLDIVGAKTLGALAEETVRRKQGGRV
jgi:hypothetical protein